MSVIAIAVATGLIAYPWIPDQQDGTFRNPVICADYSDPDVIRDGDDFYMTASSFNCTPALPILHSRDLVNWRLINHAVQNLPDERYNEVQPGAGVWAPTIRKHDGRFWIFFPMPDEGIYVTTAADPAGTWSEPHLLVAGKGLIDPCPLWDDDGRAYLVHGWARSRSGIKHRLTVVEMAPDGSKLIGEPRTVFEDPERHPTIEGPKFHKRDGWYYISAPAGGVEKGWQVILRSRNVFGPYEDRTVLAQGSTPINGPHQGALVDTPGGEWWFVHFQDAGVYGRITHLQPVRWEGGWPVMGVNHDEKGIGEPVLQYAKPNVPPQPIAVPQTDDEFDQDKLGLQWQWHANHRDDWASLTDRPGHLRLRALPARADLGLTPSLLLQKLPARAFSTETLLELSSAEGLQAGLIVTGQTHAAVAVERTANGPQIVFILNSKITDRLDLDAPRVELRVEMADGGLCRFAWRKEGNWRPIGEPFQATEGHWIGAKVGLFCRSMREPAAGHADFDYFRFGR